MDRDRVEDAAVQRTIRIAPGERTEVTVFRDDPDYDLAYAACSAPCKMIRTAGPGGTLSPSGPEHGTRAEASASLLTEGLHILRTPLAVRQRSPRRRRCHLVAASFSFM